MSTLTTTTTTVRTIRVPAVITHSKFTRTEEEMAKKGSKISEKITPGMLNALGRQVAAAHQPSHHQPVSTSAHPEWKIFSEIDVETKIEHYDCSEARGCCHHEGLEGRLSASNKQCARDLPGTENMRTCGDGHSECSSHNSQADECRHHDNSPCDCCRHGHLTSFIRGPEDCRTCLRHMGGAFVSPKYPQIRQRMLKTLIQRRDHSEEDSGDSPKVKAEPISVKSIPCGKKERLIILNPENKNDNVDDLVRMIEGTKLCNDPRKLAKKARQKEKKMQVKFEEDLRREEEERRIREEAERAIREQEEREEEERRRSEELKRQARRQKKKNRKKKDSEKITESSHPANDTYGTAKLKIDSKQQNDSSLSFSVSNVKTSTSPSDTVRKVLETVKPLSDDAANADKPRMVTIRRHPATHDNQNVVTITLSDDKQGKSPVYMLVNGHLVSTDSFSGQEQQQSASSSNHVEANDVITDKKKKKNKKKQQKLEGSVNGDSAYNHHQSRDNLSALPLNAMPAMPSATNDNTSYSPVDLENLSLPPGITITKVPNTRKCESFPERPTQEKITQYRIPLDPRNYAADDDDIFGRKESEEFEEVINNKTRRKRMKAARTTTDQRDGSEDTDTRESPKHMTRRPFICDSKPIEKIVETPKAGISCTISKKPNGKPIEHMVSKSRRDHTFRHDGFSSSNHNQVPVMPRLHRAHMKNGDVMLSNCNVSANYDGRQSYPVVDSENKSVRMEAASTERLFVGNSHPSPQQQVQGRGNGIPSMPPTMPGYMSHTSFPPVAAPSPIGRPISIKAESNEESWNPWKDWSEQTTPEHPTPRYGIRDLFQRVDAPPKTYAFHELVNKSKSPIQRPSYNVFESNFLQLNENLDSRSFCRDRPATSFSSFPQQSSQFEHNGEQMFRIPQQQQQQTDPTAFAPNLPSYNNEPLANQQTEQDKISWNAFSGVQIPPYLQRRPSDKADFVLTQQSPTQGISSADLKTWETYARDRNPMQSTAEKLNKLSLSPLQMCQLPPSMSTSAGISPSLPYGMGSYQPQELADRSGFPMESSPGHEWQARPSSANNFSKTPFERSQPESYNWELGPAYSRYTGGGAV